MEQENQNSIPKENSQDKSKELIGGLKNALERGENIQKAKKSFVNAGYNIQDVENAARQISGAPIPQQTIPSRSQPIKQTQQNQTNKPQKNQSKQTQQKIIQKNSNPLSEKPKKPLPKILIIIMIIISVLILIGAAVLGLYWDKIAEVLF